MSCLPEEVFYAEFPEEGLKSNYIRIVKLD
jgi:hypothetical protein